MSLRKSAMLLAGAALAVGLVGNGVGAQFVDSVTAKENINVGTFACKIVNATQGAVIAVDGKSVTYTAPTINSSAPGSAPFSFTVKNAGSIAQELSVTAPSISAPWSIIGAPFGTVSLGANAITTYNTGVSWDELNNANLGQGGTLTWTVNCNEGVAGAVVFDNTPAVVPSNLPSYGPEAYSYNEWGAGATLAGTARNLRTATVTLSSWACQSGSWDKGDCVTTPGATYNVPITFNVYGVGTGDAVGALIATDTETFAIPYRPSADPGHCPKDPTYYAPDAVKWYDGTGCVNGLAVNVSFTFDGTVTLPDNVIFGVAFNSDHHGYSPLGGTNSPTDSLNIGTYPGTGDGTVAVAPSVGAWLPDGLSTYASTDGTPFAGPTTAVNSSMNDFGGYMPPVQITASN